MEAEKRIFQSKNLTGFRISPNPYPSDLETALGIQFTTPPVRIELSARNRLVLRVRNGKGISTTMERTEGFYDPYYNAYFVEQGEVSRLTSWHENMHGYSSSHKPDQNDSIHGIYHRLLPELRRGNVDSVARIEPFSTRASTEEGIADWGKINTTQVLGDSKERAEAERLTKLEDHRVEKAISAFETYIARLIKLFERGFRNRTPRKVSRAVLALESLMYMIGYHFVSQTMEIMLKSGMSIEQALEILIKSPPLSTEQLKNPDLYLSDRVKK